MAEEEKMSEATKIIFAFVGVMIVGFIIVGTSGVTEDQKKSNAGMMHYSNLSRMSTVRCPKAVKKHTGQQVYAISNTITDKQTYFTVEYTNSSDAFKKASCTINQMGVLTELVIDGKKVISK